MYLIYLALPARILFFIPLIICTIILRIRSYTDNCEESMKYYNLCSAKYGDEFKNNFNGIMNITTYTLCVGDYHSFLVGNCGLVVHNICKPNEKYANEDLEKLDLDWSSIYDEQLLLTRKDFAFEQKDKTD